MEREKEFLCRGGGGGRVAKKEDAYSVEGKTQSFLKKDRNPLRPEAKAIKCFGDFLTIGENFHF